MILKHKNVFFIIFQFLLILAALGPNLKAEWGIIDDYEIVRGLGPENNLKYSDIFDRLKFTEVAIWGGANGRFRPGYYVLRFVEIATLGNSPAAWYFLRLLVASFFSYALFMALSKLGWSFYLTSSLSLLISTFPLWGDVYTRLGPSEVYVAFGMALSLFSYAKFSVNKWYTLLFYAGGILAILNKENFIFLALLLPYLAIRLFPGNKKMHALGITGTVISSIIMSIGILNILQIRAVDVYGKKFYSFSGDLFLSPTLFLIILLILVSWFVKRKIPSKSTILPLMILLGLEVFQLLFYRERPSISSRYALPYYPLVLLSVGIVLNEVLSEQLIKKIFFPLAICLSICFCYHILEKSRYNVDRTINFKLFLDKVYDFSKTSRSKDRHVIVDTFRPWDFEYILSLQEFFSWRKINVPLKIINHTRFSDAKTDQEKEFIQLLKTLEERKAYLFPGYYDCLNVGLHRIGSSNCYFGKYIIYF